MAQFIQNIDAARLFKKHDGATSAMDSQAASSSFNGSLEDPPKELFSNQSYNR
jgi:hypothetical protein